MYLPTVKCSIPLSRIKALQEYEAQSNNSWEPSMKAQLQAMNWRLDEVQQGPVVAPVSSLLASSEH